MFEGSDVWVWVPPMEWDGARNLHDVGSAPLRLSGETRAGRVWRSAAREWMTEVGWGQAGGDGLRTVVDLRNDGEIGRGPEHPEVESAAMANVEIIHAPTEDPHDPTFLETCGHLLDTPLGWEPNARLYPDLLAVVFETIAAAKGGVLVHCAGGRDRTGMVVAMLLQLADVTAAGIEADYIRGYLGAARHPGHSLGYDAEAGEWVPATEQPQSTAELADAVAERRTAVASWCADFDTETYLREAGLSVASIDRLRSMLR